MLKDFAFQIDCYGHIPNGNRTYYLSRSQPPFFSLMVDLIAQREGDGSYATYLPELESEYEYWMDGSAFLQRGQAYRRLVRLADGTVLNRFWDDRAVPRDESYREDVETALGHNRDPGDLYRNLRAAAESGWDFSSRWLADGHSLNTIRTVSLLPIDLNSLMVHLEQTLAKAYQIKGDAGRSSRFAKPLTARRRFGVSCGTGDRECLPTMHGRSTPQRCRLQPPGYSRSFSMLQRRVKRGWRLRPSAESC